MEFPFKKNVCTEAETVLLAEEFALALKPGDLILLNGDLGTGKTFFVKSACARLGIENVSSPSFAIVNEYRNGRKIFHFDFYRIKKIEELHDIGFEDYLLSGDAVVFIEWADMFPDILPQNHYTVLFKFIDSTSREISIIKHE